MRKDHEWILDHLDIWQLGVYHKRIIRIKVKELKTQALLFYGATSGLEGVKFSGMKTPGDFWKIEEPQIRREIKKYATEDEVNAVAKLFGGFGNAR